MLSVIFYPDSIVSFFSIRQPLSGSDDGLPRFESSDGVILCLESSCEGINYSHKTLTDNKIVTTQ